MKLLVLGLNFAPEIISTGVYTTGLSDWMARRGHRVDVVTAQPHYPDWRVFDGWPRFGYRRQRRDSGVRAVHCPHYVPARPSGARRLLHQASFVVTAAPVVLWQALTGRPDAVLLVAPSMLGLPLAWCAARLGRAKLWMHVQDFEVEAAFMTGLLPATGPVARLARGFERWCLNRCDLVTTISDPMLAKLRDKGVPPTRCAPFRNWADLSRVTPQDPAQALKRDLGITTPHVALYAGNLGNKQGLEIIPAVAACLKERSDLTFVIAGEGSALRDLRDRAAGLDNLVFAPLQPLDALSDLLSIADVHLLPQLAGAADLVLPSKLTNMLASGRPVVATTLPGTALAQEVAGAGIVTPPGDAAAMAGAIAALLDDTDRRHAMGQAARARALAAWDSTAILTGLEAQLCALTETATPAVPA